MRAENQFNHEHMEKILFPIYMPSSPDKRRTRKYLRKMARHIEKAWEVGCRDGMSGKPLVPLAALPGMSDDSPLLRGIGRRAYVAYQAGYRVGCEEVQD